MRQNGQMKLPSLVYPGWSCNRIWSLAQTKRGYASSGWSQAVGNDDDDDNESQNW